MKSNYNFITLFNFNYLPQGLTMYFSLIKNCPSARLWVLCMDEKVEFFLKKLKLINLNTISLKDFENKKLLSIKQNRKFIEYCWTLTPFLPTFFFKEFKKKSVVYIDADLYFFNKLDPIFEEFDKSKKSVFVTEHGFHKKFDSSNINGKFCVQFLIYRNDSKTKKILNWWQDRCIEWCYDYPSEGKFGDQKYLDHWPNLFKSYIHISKNLEYFQGPWTLNRFKIKNLISYHFHGLKINSDKVLIYNRYGFTKKIIKKIYFPYVVHLKKTLKSINYNFTQSTESFFRVKSFYYYLKFNILGKKINKRLIFKLSKINEKN